jgi:hypothetical protein
MTDGYLIRESIAKSCVSINLFFEESEIEASQVDTIRCRWPLSVPEVLRN